MRKIVLLLLSLSLATAFTSCDVEDRINELLEDLVQFDIDADTNVTIDIAPAGTISIANTITTNIEEELANNNFKQENIAAIIFKELTLNIPESSSISFDVIESISIKIGAEGLDLREVVAVSSITNNSKSLNLTSEVSKEDLTQYLLNDTIVYELTITTKEAITEAISLDIGSTFTVTPKVNL